MADHFEQSNYLLDPLNCHCLGCCSHNFDCSEASNRHLVALTEVFDSVLLLNRLAAPMPFSVIQLKLSVEWHVEQMLDVVVCN